MYSVEVKNVTKAFSKFTAISDVSFSAHEGESTIVLGPNGAGKSTLLKMIAGLYRPTDGMIKLFGNALDTRTRDKLSRRFSFLGENYALYDNLSVRANISFFAKLYDVDDAERRMNDILAEFDALEYLDRKVGELSRGTKQKVAICRALVNDPEILLLDEPTAFLDQNASDTLHKMLEKLSSKKVTILYATQRLEELYKIKSNVILIESGRITASGTLGSIMRKLGSIQVEVALINKLGRESMRKLFGKYGLSYGSGSLLKAKVKSINEIPRLIEEISREGGLIINVNYINGNVGELMKGGS